jgi:hypothetical protein
MHFLPSLLDIKETDLILWILTLIDLSLAGNLLLIVIFSGFDSRLAIDGTRYTRERRSLGDPPHRQTGR